MATSAPRRDATAAISLPPHLLDLLAASPPRKLGDGEVLFREGDRADRVYFVTEGTLRVTKQTQTGDVVVGSVGPADVLGEIGVLLGIGRTATATASGPAQLLSVDAEAFTRIVVDADVTARELGQLALRRHAGNVLATLLSPGHGPERITRGTLRAVDAAPAETIIRRGDRATHFYLLVAGAVDVVVEGPTGETLRLAQLQAPDCFGEVAMLDDHPRNATVRVADEAPARLITLDREAFDALVEDPDAKHVLVLLARHRDGVARH